MTDKTPEECAAIAKAMREMPEEARNIAIAATENAADARPELERRARQRKIAASYRFGRTKR